MIDDDHLCISKTTNDDDKKNFKSIKAYFNLIRVF